VAGPLQRCFLTGVSDLLDDDIGVVEGGSAGGDVVRVAGEDLGGAVERGRYDDQGADDVRPFLVPFCDRSIRALRAI
jgi:hypothetical protein